MRLLLPLSLLALQQSTRALTENRTIDDTLGDLETGFRPIYLPPAKVWEDATCSECALKPDPKMAFQNTWTAGTYTPDLVTMSVQLSFKGTAIYVYFIIANSGPPTVTTTTICDFILDGQPEGSFHSPTGKGLPQFEYNVLVFSRDNLPNTNHTLVFSTSKIVQRHIYVNFDYAIYTFDDGIDISPVSSPPAPLVSVIGGALPTLSPSTLDPLGSFTSIPTPAVTVTYVPVPTSTLVVASQALQAPEPSSSETAESHENSPSSKRGTGAIAGGVIGGITALLILALLFLTCYRRKHSLGPQVKEFIRSKSRKISFRRRAASTLGLYTDRPGTPNDFYPSRLTTSPYPIIPFTNYTPRPSQTGRDSNDQSSTRGYGVGFPGKGDGALHGEKEGTWPYQHMDYRFGKQLPSLENSERGHTEKGHSDEEVEDMREQIRLMRMEIERLKAQ